MAPRTEHTLLSANRGEIAVRIAQAAAELGMRTVGVHAADDARALHVRQVDEVRAREGHGVAAYLDVEQLIAVARAAGCDMVHPGYGFLSEDAGFARRCTESGLAFVGPAPEVLERLGDKTTARALARSLGVPVIAGTDGPTSLGEARAFLASASGAAIVVKAVAGGGGRGMRVVAREEDLDDAWERCRSEARAAFGRPEVYVERLVARARHVEVQIVGDGSGAVTHLWDRECSLQRRHQKIAEIAPSPALSPALRARLCEAAVRIVQTVAYRGVGTVEFLVDLEAGEGPGFAFLEVNPRLQVEHPVTEMITGVDLVQTQLRLATGCRLADVGLEQAAIAPPTGHAIELRVNMETLGDDGAPRPSAGTLATFAPPSGPGVRVDTLGYAGYTVSPRFDALLAKLIVHVPTGGLPALFARAERALSEFGIVGVATNAALLHGLLRHPDVIAGRVHTRFVEEQVGALLAAGRDGLRARYFEAPHAADARAADEARIAPGNAVAVVAPMQSTVVSIDVGVGDAVHAGEKVAVLEAMKMEHVVETPIAGIVRRIAVVPGETLDAQQPIVFVEPAVVDTDRVAADDAVDLDAIRPDLAESRTRHAQGLDAERPDAVARRPRSGQRTAREHAAEPVDEGGLVGDR